MLYFQKYLEFFRIASVDPEVMESQASAFTKQVPLLHLILNVNVMALAYTHYGIAPNVLTITFPALLFCVCAIRVFIWRHAGTRTMTQAKARAMLLSTYRLSGLLGVIFTTWALFLYPYGDAYAKSHVAFFMSITVIGCIFCLMHLRPAALLLTVIVSVPFIIRFTTTGEPVLTAIALNFGLVAIVMIFILFTYYRDFTALVHSQKHLVALSDQNFKMANLDSLTDLPNRRNFFRDLEALIAADDLSKGGFVVGLVDLDGFKPINDVYGHAAGDRVLIEVGRRLKVILGPAATVARLGGDEFGFILPLMSEAEIAERGEAICAAISFPITLPSGIAQVSASIGFAPRVGATATQEQLLERADYALYYAKAKHRGTAVLFSKHHENAIHMQSLIEQDLRRADLEDEMFVEFQPIVDVGPRRIIAYEALARWKSPLLGKVAPLDFIAAAERTGLINRLTEILFAKALAAAADWPADLVLSFNLSVHDIASADLIARVRTMIEAAAFPASRILFEITETALMHDFEQARDMLLGLKVLGARIALDDFGTGFSSLNYVHRLPLDKIKIDRSFMAGVTSDRACRDIVKSIIDLSRNLGICCVVEGVETEEQMTIVRRLGCSTMQGYLFGRAIGNDELDHIFTVAAGRGSADVRNESRHEDAIAAV